MSLKRNSCHDFIHRLQWSADFSAGRLRHQCSPCLAPRPVRLCWAMIFVAVGRESTCGFFQVIYEMENVYNCIYVVCGSVLFGGSAGAVKNLKGCSMPGSVTIKRNCTAIIHFSAPLYFTKHMINCSTIMDSNLFRILHLSWRIARRLFVRKHLANGCKWFIAL